MNTKKVGNLVEHQQVENDITVVGGGLAGVCAAIAAARAGARVALIQNRPVLGGNSSSEVRVWVCGATAHGVQQFARETGIMGEFFIENQFTNPDGNPYYWDLVIAEAVRAEPNISLYLNTDVREVEAAGPNHDRRIISVEGWQMGSERLITFRSPTFIDCSGDGLVGYLAGALYRTGRESRNEFDESWAPETPDNNTLGSTILFYSKDVGHPVKFVPPKIARDVTQTAIPERRVIRSDYQGCAYWWIEWGGELDVVRDNEKIRDELHAVVYGIWDYIKNSGNFDADNLSLEWIGSVPGKREYRRFVGDYVLTQHDIVEQTLFPDRVAFGGWSIDLHPVGGVYAAETGAYHWHPDGNYHVPLRCLYSRNVSNMFMAGRNISATHVAFGGTRVMGTCAVIGEAAGTAAALSTLHGLTPRELATERFDLMHHALVRADSSVLGVENLDPDDLSRAAHARASSTLEQLSVSRPDAALSLESSLGVVLPVDTSLNVMELLVDVRADTELVVDLYEPSKPQNYLPSKLVKTVEVQLKQGAAQFARIPLDWSAEEPRNVFMVLRANPEVSVHTSEESVPGTLFFSHRAPDADNMNSLYFREWKPILKRKSVVFRLEGRTRAFRAQRVIGGYSRPYGGPQMWSSDLLERDSEPWIALEWPESVTFDEVVVVFDDEVDEDLINLHHHFTPHEVMPGLVRDYQLQVGDGDDWRTVATVDGNRHRRRSHRLPQPLTTHRLRLVVRTTNGAPRAHVFAIRTYRNGVTNGSAGDQVRGNTVAV